MKNKGISSMQDAILFLLMVSISGVILFPALTNDAIIKSQMEREKDEMAYESLFVLLSTTEDEFSYRIAGEILSNALKKAGVNISGSKYGNAIFDHLLERKQYHKTIGNLIGENLASQLILPLKNKKVRINLLTAEFDTRLKERIDEKLKEILGNSYKYNFSACWQPIANIPFGELCVGSPPPPNAYVAKAWITMPFSPRIKIGKQEVVISKEWLFEKIRQSEAARNISYNLSYNVQSLYENFTELINDCFHWVINISMHFIFCKITDLFEGMNEEKISNATGSFIASLDTLFGKDSYGITEYFINKIAETISSKINISMNIEKIINELTAYIIQAIGIEEMSYSFISKQNEIKMENMYEWIFERICISKARVSLIIWEA